MKTIGNVIWFIFGGLESAIFLFLSGILCCISIIFIPVGIAYFKLAGFVLWPFGKEVVKPKPNGIFKKLVNAIWCITGGLVNALANLLIGVVYCITIIGIPFGLQFFKIARFVLLPVGREFRKAA